MPASGYLRVHLTEQVDFYRRVHRNETLQLTDNADFVGVIGTAKDHIASGGQPLHQLVAAQGHAGNMPAGIDALTGASKITALDQGHAAVVDKATMHPQIIFVS